MGAEDFGSFIQDVPGAMFYQCCSALKAISGDTTLTSMSMKKVFRRRGNSG